MLKGVSRRVIVVRSPDHRLFEQAIFIVREGAADMDGVTADAVVTEARRVADSFSRKGGKGWRSRLTGPGWAALGAALASLLWWLSGMMV